MRVFGAAFLLSVLSALPCSSVQAQGGASPRLVPARDVDVTYAIPRGTTTLSQRLRWSAALSRLRIDPPTPGLFTIVDYTAHRMTTVRESDRAAFDTPAPAAALPGAGATPSRAYVRGAADRIAGLDCTEWETRDNDGHATTVCITADGVLLRARGASGVMLSAQTVRYATQDAALFEVPAGYAHKAPRQEGAR